MHSLCNPLPLVCDKSLDSPPSKPPVFNNMNITCMVKKEGSLFFLFLFLLPSPMLHKLVWIAAFFIVYVYAENKVVAMGQCDQATEDIRCRYACGPELLQPMCISGQCYCTNVGSGSCRTGNNNDGCKAVCEYLGKTSTGCFENECNCQ